MRFERDIRKILNESGSTMLVAMIGIAMVSLFSLAYADIYSSTRRIQKHVDFLNAIAQIQLTIVNTVNDANSWSVTLADSTNNPSMACLAAGNCTSAVSATGFVLWPAEETSYANKTNAVYDGTNGSAGFTLNGTPCSTFSNSGSINCPIHINLTWSTPGCSPAPCTPPVTVTADVQFRPGPNSPLGPINENSFTLGFVQKSTLQAIPCSGAPTPAETALCASPPYSGYRLYCTPTGFRCGQVYY